MCNFNTDHGKLFQIVYEKETKQREEMEAHIWSYRPRITLKHLSLSLLREKDASSDISVLKEFLKKVCKWHYSSMTVVCLYYSMKVLC